MVRSISSVNKNSSVCFHRVGVNSSDRVDKIQRMIHGSNVCNLWTDLWCLGREICPEITYVGIMNRSLNFVDPATGVHTNGVECFWNNCKRTFKKMSRTTCWPLISTSFCVFSLSHIVWHLLLYTCINLLLCMALARHSTGDPCSEKSKEAGTEGTDVPKFSPCLTHYCVSVLISHLRARRWTQLSPTPPHRK